MIKQTISLRLIAVTAFILALCSIIYELLMAKILGQLSGNIILWQSITIGIYLFSLGMGTLYSESLKSKNDSSLLLKVELLLSLAGSLGFFLVFFVHVYYKIESIEQFVYIPNYGISISQSKTYPFVVFIGVSELITIVIGFLSGLEIPLLIRVMRNSHHSGKENIIIGINYIGALAGTLLFSLVLMPVFNTLFISCLIAFLNIIIAAYFYFKVSFVKSFKNMIAIVLAFLFLSGLVLVGEKVRSIHSKVFYSILYQNIINVNFNKESIKRLDDKVKILKYKSIYQEIDIVGTDDDNWNDYTVYIDGHFQFNSITERKYHEAMAHIPMMAMSASPVEVLILGGGDGLVTRELLKYKSIKKITQIELDPMMVKLAKENSLFVNLNKNSLSDSRVNLIIQDGFYYVRNTSITYDAIYIDFPYPYSYDVLKLYSIEFYKNLRKILKPQGFIVLDLPLVSEQRKSLFVNKEYNDVFFSTLYFAGFTNVFPYEIRNETFMILSPDKEINKRNIKLNSYLTLLTEENLKESESIKFVYSIKKEYVNSVFKPKLINFKDNNF